MSRDAAYFDALYAGDADPWRFASSPYERAKYAATLAALPRARFASALEVGCSIGVFTRQLADRCDRLLGVDLSSVALDQARARCADAPQVILRQAALPAQWPGGVYDLIVLSEVLYFLDAGDIARTAACIEASLATGGSLLLVNWRGDTGTALSGEAAADLLLGALTRPARLTTQRQPEYRLDLRTG